MRFVSCVTSYVMNGMELLAICFRHSETLTTFDGRKMMLFANLRTFGTDHTHI